MIDAIVRELGDEPDVAGLVLTGSMARHGMATEHSDVDMFVVLFAPNEGRRRVSTPRVDLPICTLDELRDVPAPPDPDPDGWWERYAFAHSRILVDHTDGELCRLIESWATLSGIESKRILESYLDGYLNYVYRSLKSSRDGRELSARLDAAESLSWGLTVVFAFERRIRPYNKYLAWELEHQPLERPEWRSEVLLPQLQAILDRADPAAQRGLLASVERAARDVGLGGIVDGWGDELDFLHGEPAG
jgi:hypothetical protein